MYITDFSNHKQSYLDLNISIPLKVTDHEAALMLMLQGLDYSKFEKPKKKSGRPPAVDSYTMMLILLYARTQGKYSSRDTEKLCKRDLFLLKVLDGKKAPDHSTIDRFIQQHSDAIDNLFYQQINRLGSLGELTKNIVFQDGTKIESKANRYTFIWKKSIKKNLPKLINHIEEIIHESVNLYPIELENSSPEDALKSIIEYLMGTTDNLKPNKTGRGHRITAEQRIFRDTNIYLKKLEDYKSQLDAMPERNSMSKTDPDATFMRMKEDHMRNGQLKPAYNL